MIGSDGVLFNVQQSSLSLPGPRNRQRWWRRRRRTRNRQCVQGIGYSGTTTEAAASRLRALGIDDHNGGVGRVRWAWGLDDNNRGVNWGSRRYNASEWTSPTAEAPVCLQARGIDNDNGGVVRVRRASRLSNYNGGIGRGRGIRNASEGPETTTEAAGARRRSRGIYDDDRGVGGGRWAQRLQQRQRMCPRRIDDASKGPKATTETAADRRQAQWISNDNGVLISIAFRLLTVTLSRLCLVAVSFWYCFHHIPFFSLSAWNNISTAIMWKLFLYKVYTNLSYVPPTYRRVTKLQFITINKDVHKSLARKKVNENPIWSSNDSYGKIK